MNKLKAGLGLILGLAALAPATQAASIAITAGNQAYSQNFDTLTTATTAQTWTNSTTLTGWNLFNSAGAAVTSYVGSTGSSNTGSFYSFGQAGATDRALGGVGSGNAYFGSPGSGAVAGYIAVELKNTSGSTLDGFSLLYNGEQWRNGGNTSSQVMAFEYGFGNTFGTVGSWNTPGTLFNFLSPVASATAAAIDGNSTGLVSNRGGAVSTAWANNATLWLRWTETNDVGNDHGLAIDNFSFTSGAAPAPVPVPPAFALMVGGLAALRRFRRK